MNGALSWLSAHGIGATGVGAAVAFVFSVYQFLSVRKRESRQREFDQYHMLIEKLVAPATGKTEIFQDQQIAVLFELRNFPRYFELTNRMLEGLKNAWILTEGWQKYESVIQEIQFTLAYIKAYRNSFFGLLWWRT
jgi:hypothetical protein